MQLGRTSVKLNAGCVTCQDQLSQHPRKLKLQQPSTPIGLQLLVYQRKGAIAQEKRLLAYHDHTALTYHGS